MAFDCLHVHGLDVRRLRLHRRRGILEQEVAGAQMVFPARRLPDHGLSAWAVVKERGYEGMVAKDEESVYRGGPTRSRVKVKIRHEGRFIVGGFSACRTRSPGSWSGSATADVCSSAARWNGALACEPPWILKRGRQRTSSPFQSRGRSRPTSPSQENVAWARACYGIVEPFLEQACT
jgi:hypothetical protein